MSASEDAPIIRLANSILGLAIKQGASDIHVEPMEGDVTVRFRIDGVLQVVQKLPKRVQLGVISRFKILSQLDIAEKRLPQDGRISVTMEGKPIDFRVSTVPGKWGEKVCMRLLDKSNTALGLDTLDHRTPPALALVREMIQQPYGIIYVTGPTGSGKTTTLYSALAEINDPGVNISTAEDPMEYDLPGRHADPGDVGHRPDVRDGPARVSAAGPRRAPGRRDARQGNGAHRRGSRAHRASRVHDAPHQQRGGGVHAAAARWGSSRSSCRRRPSASSRSGWRGVCASSARSQYPPTPTPPLLRPRRRGATLYPRGGMRDVRRQGHEGASRHLRSDAHERRAAGDGRLAAPGPRRSTPRRSNRG